MNAYQNKNDINTFQDKQLQAFLNQVNHFSPYYKRLFKQENIDISKIVSIDQLHQLPFTTKDDLATYNNDFLCVPKNKIADFITTSGSLGDPVAFYLTKKDIQRLAYNEMVSLQCAGGTSDDIYQLMTTIDKRFMAGLAYQQGIMMLDAGIIRIGPGAAFLQWESIQQFSPTILIAIPSFIPKLIDYALQHNIDYKNTSVKSIVCIGESIRHDDFSLNELGKRITEIWDLKLYSTYASTEMGVAFTECVHGLGGHHNPELVILEVINDHNESVNSGESGEVVVTTLGVEGMPLLRYRTGDLCTVHYKACACGRSTARLGPVIGRKQQMIKFKGTTIFPPAIFDVLDTVKSIGLYQIEVAQNEFSNDKITIILPDHLKDEYFERTLLSLFRSKLRVTPFLRYEHKSILQKRIFVEEKRKPQKLVYL